MNFCFALRQFDYFSLSYNPAPYHQSLGTKSYKAMFNRYTIGSTMVLAHHGFGITAQVHPFLSLLEFYPKLKCKVRRPWVTQKGYVAHDLLGLVVLTSDLTFQRLLTLH